MNRKNSNRTDSADVNCCTRPRKESENQKSTILDETNLEHNSQRPETQTNTRSNRNTEEPDAQAINSYINSAQYSNSSLLSNFPPINIFSPDDDVTIRKLIEFLEEFNRKRDSIILEANAVNHHLLTKLRELNNENEQLKRENEQLKRENAEIKQRLDAKDKTEKRLQSKLSTLEAAMRNQQANMLQKENQKPLSESDSNAGSNIVEKKKPREESVDTSLPSTQFIDAPSPPTHFTAVQLPPPTITTTTATPVAFRSSRITTHTVGRIGGSIAASTSSSHHNSNIPPLPPVTPSSFKIMTSSSHIQHQYNRYNQAPTAQQQQSRIAAPPFSREGVPVANRRAERRSRSADNWLDHRPQTTVKTDTVLQPKMQRKKSVSKIELHDAKKSSKYLLTHQQQDEDGEMITNLIRGDILKSAAGGASVIFTDVETMFVKTQEAGKPVTQRKRGSEDVTNPDDRIMIEERCAMAIEGHSMIRKSIK